MSSTPSARSEPAGSVGRTLPDWFWACLGVDGPWQGARAIGGQSFEIRGGIPRSASLLSEAQAQTEETFGFKWKKRETFESPASLARMRDWLVERYGAYVSYKPELGSITWPLFAIPLLLLVVGLLILRRRLGRTK